MGVAYASKTLENAAKKSKVKHCKTYFYIYCNRKAVSNDVDENSLVDDLPQIQDNKDCIHYFVQKKTQNTIFIFGMIKRNSYECK